ncbi:8725_t:CDS:2, partial [Dentiscutata erythropus]
MTEEQDNYYTDNIEENNPLFEKNLVEFESFGENILKYEAFDEYSVDSEVFNEASLCKRLIIVKFAELNIQKIQESLQLNHTIKANIQEIG